MQRLSYPTDTVLSNNITRNRIVLSFKDSPRKPLRRRPYYELLDKSSRKLPNPMRALKGYRVGSIQQVPKIDIHRKFKAAGGGHVN